jgi:hypothetical protein
MRGTSSLCDAHICLKIHKYEYILDACPQFDGRPRPTGPRARKSSITYPRHGFDSLVVNLLIS